MFLVQAGTFLCFQAGRSAARRSSASDLTEQIRLRIGYPESLHVFSEFRTARIFRLRIRLRMAPFPQSKHAAAQSVFWYGQLPQYVVSGSNLRINSRHSSSTYSELYFVHNLPARNLSNSPCRSSDIAL